MKKSSLRFALQVVTFCKRTDGLICALGSRDRYRLSVLVEEDEEAGLSPHFAYILFTHILSLPHGKIILSALFRMDSILLTDNLEWIATQARRTLEQI